MKPRTSLVLAIIAVVAVLAGWYFGVRKTVTAASSVVPGQLAFPGLVPRLQQAARIEIRHQGSTLVLERRGDAWGVAEDSDYPARPGKVRDLLAGLAELRLTERRTAEPSQFGRLGVADPGKPNADSSLVSVFDAAGKPIVALIVGHSRMRGQSDLPDQIFVRRPGENQSWLAEGRLPLDDDALMWLDRDIVNIDHTKIVGVAVTRAGQHLDLVRGGDDKLEMKFPPEHPELDEAKLGDVARALEFLSFMRVEPAAKMPGKPLGESTFTTADGLALHVGVNQAGNEIWAHFAAAGNGAAKTAAEQLDRKLTGWAYELGGWKEKVLVPAMDDLKAPPPPAAAPTPAAPPTSQAPAPEAPAPEAPAPKPPASPGPDAPAPAASAPPPAAAGK